MNDMDDVIIKIITGFPSLSAMVCYILLLYKGNIIELMENKSTLLLTWFEEWLVVFERLWGDSMSRWGHATL
jgi:hypothetical protein